MAFAVYIYIYVHIFICIYTYTQIAQIAQDGRGIVRACADDVGVALASYRHLKFLFPIFATAEDIAGLALKPPKCNIVFTFIEFSENIVLVIHAWLRKHIP